MMAALEARGPAWQPMAVPARDQALDDTMLAEPTAAGEDDWTGTSFDHFDVGLRLGAGAMGAVYRGHDRSLDRPVAIKVLHRDLDRSSALVARFVREARAQAKLRSAHVTAIHYVGETPCDSEGRRSLYFAMELVPGGALDGLLEAGRTLEPERARQLMIQAARGLRDAFRAGIIHRDIKPANLLIDEQGELKLADFGVAKPMGRDAEQLTKRGAIIGTPHYLSPQQASGAEVDHRTDMYALGATFFHLLAGRPPFEGKSSLHTAIMHIRDPAPRLREHAAHVPPALAAIVDRLLQKDPQARFADYDELIAALEAAAPAAVRPAGFWARSAAAAIDAIFAVGLVSALGWVGALVYLAYVTLAHARRGQTLGKYLLRMQAERLEGGSLGLGRSAARTMAAMWLPLALATFVTVTGGFGELARGIEQVELTELDAMRSMLVAWIVGNVVMSLTYLGGLALAAVHPHKRAVHDLVAGTRVVYRLD